MRSIAFRRFTFRWLAPLVPVLACSSGTVVDAPFPPGRPISSPPATSASPPPPAASFCDQARTGSQCPFEIVCEQKDSANAACNPTLRCDYEAGPDFTWALEPAAKSCPDFTSACPASYAEAPVAACDPSLLCEYDEGTCGCSAAIDGDAGGVDADADAGDAGAIAYVWHCVAPKAGCPNVRPPIGSECVRPMTCDYGAGIFEDGLVMRCEDRQWRVDP